MYHGERDVISGPTGQAMKVIFKLARSMGGENSNGKIAAIMRVNGYISCMKEREHFVGVTEEYIKASGKII